MKLKTLLFGKTYAFRDVKDVLAKANEPKSGDRLAGLAAESAQERVAAKAVLAELLLRDLRENPAVPYEQDEVTRIIQDDLNERIYAEMQNWTVSATMLIYWYSIRRSSRIMPPSRILPRRPPVWTGASSTARSPLTTTGAPRPVPVWC